MKAGDLVKPKNASWEGCKEWFGLVVRGLDRHGLVKVHWFGGTNNPSPWQAEELEVVSEGW